MAFHSLRKNYTRGYLGTSVNTGGVFDLFDLFDNEISEISVVGTSNVRGNGSASDLSSIDYPSGIASGDIIVLFSGNDPQDEAYQPSNFTGWTRRLGSTTTSYQILTKSATGTESGSLSLDFGSGEGRPGAAMIVLRGAKEIPEDTDFNEQGSGSLVANSVTVSTPRSIHIVAYFGNLSSTGTGAPSGMTAFSNNSFDEFTMSEAFYELEMSPGSTGTRTLGGGATSDATVALSATFAPASS